MKKMIPVTSPTFHTPVLLNEVVNSLNIESGKWYIDATAGGGGHTAAIIEKKAHVLAIDQDEAAIERLKGRFADKKNYVRIQHGNFRNLAHFVTPEIRNDIKGILFDLGMSTYQIKESGRGFSFREDADLDMRMNQKNSLTAAEIINTYTKDDLYEIFTKFGEEQLADRIAESIVRSRAQSAITTTRQLQKIVAEEYHKAHIRTKIDEATKVFQSLRIAVNEELVSLKEVLPEAVNLLGTGGRLVIISFHSLEDRIVKNFFKDQERAGRIKQVQKKPIIATASEIEQNSAARSAKMRIAEKI